MVRHLVGLLWELPQNVLGLGVFACQRVLGNVLVVERKKGRYLIELRGDGAVSLGYFVFHSKHDNRFVPVGIENRDHEWGHSVQSKILGPLYLLVVGVPSSLRVAYAILHHRRTGQRWAHYYDGWPENIADLWGGVDKTKRPAP